MDLSFLAASATPFLGSVRVLREEDVAFDFRGWNARTLPEALRRAGWKGGRVAYLSAYDPAYTRTMGLLSILRRCGIETEFLSFPGRPGSLLAAVPGARRRCEALLLGFRGHELLPAVRALAPRTPLVFDAFVSVWDTLCGDRQTVPSAFPFGPALHAYDSLLCRLADAVLVDTQAHAAFFREEFGCTNVFPLYVEADPALFRPLPDASVPGMQRVLWYGTGQPLHGTPTILRWAESLAGDPSVAFRMIGPLPRMLPSNVSHARHVPLRDLPGEIAAATLCLGGPFGESGKARRVIPGKVFQMLACGKPVLVRETAAMGEFWAGE